MNQERDIFVQLFASALRHECPEFVNESEFDRQFSKENAGCHWTQLGALLGFFEKVPGPQSAGTYRVLPHLSFIARLNGAGSSHSRPREFENITLEPVHPQGEQARARGEYGFHQNWAEDQAVDLLKQYRDAAPLLGAKYREMQARYGSENQGINPRGIVTLLLQYFGVTQKEVCDGIFPGIEGNGLSDAKKQVREILGETGLQDLKAWAVRVHLDLVHQREQFLPGEAIPALQEACVTFDFPLEKHGFFTGKNDPFKTVYYLFAEQRGYARPKHGPVSLENLTQTLKDFRKFLAPTNLDENTNPVTRVSPEHTSPKSTKQVVGKSSAEFSRTKAETEKEKEKETDHQGNDKISRPSIPGDITRSDLKRELKRDTRGDTRRESRSQTSRGGERFSETNQKGFLAAARRLEDQSPDGTPLEQLAITQIKILLEHHDLACYQDAVVANLRKFLSAIPGDCLTDLQRLYPIEDVAGAMVYQVMRLFGVTQDQTREILGLTLTKDQLKDVGKKLGRSARGNQGDFLPVQAAQWLVEEHLRQAHEKYSFLTEEDFSILGVHLRRSEYEWHRHEFALVARDLFTQAYLYVAREFGHPVPISATELLEGRRKVAVQVFTRLGRIVSRGPALHRPKKSSKVRIAPGKKTPKSLPDPQLEASARSDRAKEILQDLVTKGFVQDNRVNHAEFCQFVSEHGFSLEEGSYLSVVAYLYGYFMEKIGTFNAENLNVITGFTAEQITRQWNQLRVAGNKPNVENQEPQERNKKTAMFTNKETRGSERLHAQGAAEGNHHEKPSPNANCAIKRRRITSRLLQHKNHLRENDFKRAVERLGCSWDWKNDSHLKISHPSAPRSIIVSVKKKLVKPRGVSDFLNLVQEAGLIE